MPSGPCISWWSVGCTRCTASSFHSFPSWFAFRYQSMPFVCFLSFLINIFFRDVYPGFDFSIPHPGSTRFLIPELDSIHIKEFKFFNPKNCSRAIRILSGMFCSSRIRILDFFTHLGSRNPPIKGSKRHRIPDPQNYFFLFLHGLPVPVRHHSYLRLKCDVMRCICIICRP